MKIIEIIPVVLSIFLLFILSIRKGFWKRKIKAQFVGYQIVKGNDDFIPKIRDIDRKHIIDIVEDINTSLGFISAIIVIILAIIINAVYAYIEGTFSVFSLDFFILCCLFLIYLIALVKMIKLKEIKLNLKCVSRLCRRFTYKQMYEFILIIGYIGLIFVIIF